MTSVTAPMVGKILEIQAKAGDRINEDDTVIVMEAMKMEIPVVATSGGTVREIKVTVGQMVEADEVLVIIE